MSQMVIKLESDHARDRVRVYIDNKHVHDMPAGEHVMMVRDDLATIFERTIELFDLNARIDLQ
jgi:hypothetical protein